MTKLKKDKWMIIGILVTLVVVVWQMGGVPFLGALILFEKGNEIQFEVDAICIEEGGTIDECLEKNVDRFITIESIYLKKAEMRILGTSGITGSYIDLLKDNRTIEQTIWTQTEGITDIQTIDLVDFLEVDTEETKEVVFHFHSETEGSIVVVTLDIEWGPNEAQRSLCIATGGTLDLDNWVCVCPADAIRSSWGKGCEYATQEIEETGGAAKAATVTAPPPAPTPSLGISQDGVKKSDITWMIIGIIFILALVFYFMFEQGPKKGFIKR